MLDAIDFLSDSQARIVHIGLILILCANTLICLVNLKKGVHFKSPLHKEFKASG